MATSIGSLLTEVDHHGLGAEAAGFNEEENESQDEPNRPDLLCDRVKVPPDQAAKRKAKQRQDGVRENLPFPSSLPQESELPESREVDAHEGEEGPEIKSLAGVLVGVANVVQSYGPANDTTPMSRML